MATNPIDPNRNLDRDYGRGPQLHDPDLRPANQPPKKPFPWGIVAAIITAAILGWLIWFFVAGAPGR
jgi:hypothetical protein